MFEKLLHDVLSLCVFFKAFTVVSPQLDPLLAGCQINREHWLQLAEEHNQKEISENSPENTEKDKDEDEDKS